MLLEQYGHILAKGLPVVTQLVENHLRFPMSIDGTGPLCSVEFFLPSIFRAVNSWNSLYSIVLDFDHAGKNVVEKFDVFYGKVQQFFILSPKRYKLTKQAFCCSRKLQGIL